MNFDDYLKHVAVVGAAGKMGRGIAFLMARCQLHRQLASHAPSEACRLSLVDRHERGLSDALSYIKTQAKEDAHKYSQIWRELYRGQFDPEDEDDIAAQVQQDMLDNITTSTDLSIVSRSHLVFEAILEDEKTKFDLYAQLKELCSKETYFLSNTSSIPIHILCEKNGLSGNLMGFHFYNPPPVQSLVELISNGQTTNRLADFCKQLASELGKTRVSSNDIAGFIGNGFFIREGIFAMNLICELGENFSFTESVFIVNQVTQFGLLRPMGTLQLIDYVGLDIFHSIAGVMQKYTPGELFETSLIETIVSAGKTGGQDPDTSQRPGFFLYSERNPKAIYNPETDDYEPMNDQFRDKIETAIGPLILPRSDWKTLARANDKDQRLGEHFQRLLNESSLGGVLTRRFLENSRDIAEKLIDHKVSDSPENIDTVLKKGFHHLYGPFDGYERKIH